MNKSLIKQIIVEALQESLLNEAPNAALQLEVEKLISKKTTVQDVVDFLSDKNFSGELLIDIAVKNVEGGIRISKTFNDSFKKDGNKYILTSTPWPGQSSKIIAYNFSMNYYGFGNSRRDSDPRGQMGDSGRPSDPVKKSITLVIKTRPLNPKK